MLLYKAFVFDEILYYKLFFQKYLNECCTNISITSSV